MGRHRRRYRRMWRMAPSLWVQGPSPLHPAGLERLLRHQGCLTRPMLHLSASITAVVWRTVRRRADAADGIAGSWAAHLQALCPGWPSCLALRDGSVSKRRRPSEVVIIDDASMLDAPLQHLIMQTLCGLRQQRLPTTQPITHVIQMEMTCPHKIVRRYSQFCRPTLRCEPCKAPRKT